MERRAVEKFAFCEKKLTFDTNILTLKTKIQFSISRMEKILNLFVAFAMVAFSVACEGQGPDGGEDEGNLSGKISLISSRDIIRANGTDVATLTVLLTDDSGMIHDISDKADIYTSTSDQPLGTVNFTAAEAGDYVLYALYGLEVSNDVNINAVSGVADTPADPNKASTDFEHNILLVQHTGTACPNCPDVMNSLKRLAEDENYASKYVHIASHSYNEDDNAYSSAATILSSTLKAKAYPWVSFNFFEADKFLGELQSMKNCIDLFHEERADVGMAASSVEIDGTIYAHIELKAAVEGNYRVGVWVLEDNIHGTQSGATASWQHMHSNCLREMAGESRNERLYGKSVGVVKAGENCATILSAQVNDKWVLGNCELVIFVAKEDGNGAMELVNCTICPVGGSVEYAYN